MPKITFEFNESPATFVKEAGVTGIPVNVNVSVDGLNRDNPGHAEQLIAILHKAAPDIIKAASDLYLEKLRAAGDVEAKGTFYKSSSTTH
ncbi:hypothetical protein ACKUTL_18825 [Serratia marcescens]|uniref:hypothetical protein n=1 Tax=Serratia marcescens TaxID=615 RepID=UPI001BD427E9|nr:hypothetical protein [Serratia marcescens]